MDGDRQQLYGMKHNASVSRCQTLRKIYLSQVAALYKKKNKWRTITIKSKE
jgi:hypothetical protein